MNNIAIIGAGASGLAAAISAAREGAQVTIYEKKDIPGKKILATGNGKCNYLNEDQCMHHFHSSSKNAEAVLKNISFSELISFFEGLGILPSSRKGYLYPMSGQAQSVHIALTSAAKELGVKILCKSQVIDLVSDHEGVFVVTENGKSSRYDHVIIAAGTNAGTKEKDSFITKIAENTGHKLIPYRPALCAIKLSEKICSYWKGIRTNAAISLYIDKDLCMEDAGELMLTDYGISGIPAFQLSYMIPCALDKNKKIIIGVDWLPDIERSRLYAFIEKLSEEYDERNISSLLYGLLPVKLADSLIFELVNSDPLFKGSKAHLLRWSNMTAKQKNNILGIIKKSCFMVKGVNGVENAQICSGGIFLDEIDPFTCLSKKDPRLYFTGELLDMNGDCGGYNLQWAWTTGILAGRAAARRRKED